MARLSGFRGVFVLACLVLAAGAAGAQYVTPPDSAASAALMSWDLQVQLLDWVTALALGGSLLAGFGVAYKLL